MALCAYHEDTEAAATCAVCKSPICDKCLEYGADGMCGMCLEMNNARKATIEANRTARQEAAASAGRAAPSPAAAGSAPAKPAAPRPATKPPTGGNGAKPAAKAPSGPLGKGGTGGKGADAKGTTRGGFCPEHDGQQLSALCTHCRKKVCPYCLDLYDLCVDCRALPHCSRHESMVSQAKCESCQLDYCKLCLDNTAFCDRCRTLGMKKVANAKQAARTPTRPLDPSKAGGKPAGTGDLKDKPAPAPKGPPSDAPAPRPASKTGPPPKQGQPGHRPSGKPGTGPLVAKKGKSKLPSLPLVAAGLILLGVGAYILMADNRPRLTTDDFAKAIRSEMELVSQAAWTIHEKTGKWPTSAAEVVAQLEDQGVKPNKLNPPLSVVVNGPGQDPGTVILNVTGDGFEVRGLDIEGRPLAYEGRDVVFTSEWRKKREKGGDSDPKEEPGGEAGNRE